jgi:hypothetical protein
MQCRAETYNRRWRRAKTVGISAGLLFGDPSAAIDIAMWVRWPAASIRRSDGE